MDNAEVLAQGILDRLPDPSGPVLLAGPIPLARLIDKTVASLIVVNARTRTSKLAKKHTDLTVVRADPLSLPLVPRSLTALIAVDLLCRLSGSPDRALACWRDALADEGRLIVVERLGWSRTVLRLLSGGRYRVLAPEDLTALFLNAGYRQIGQALTKTSMLITSGRVREF